jgi:hypothetical protein
VNIERNPVVDCASVRFGSTWYSCELYRPDDIEKAQDRDVVLFGRIERGDVFTDRVFEVK